MSSTRRGRRETRTRRVDAFARAASLAAAVAFFGACATRPLRRVPATPAQAAGILPRWQVFRDAAVARPPVELFYDVRATRSVFSESFVAAVRDDPGRSLFVVVEGPLGVALARATWDGSKTVVERLDRPAKARAGEGDGSLSTFGIPLSARALSLLLFGVPEISPPERVELQDGHAWLSWEGGGLACEFDPAAALPLGVVVGEGRRRVTARFLGWRQGIPSRITLVMSGGGRAELVLRTEGEAAP